MNLKYQKILPLDKTNIKNLILFIHGLGDSPAGFAGLFQQLQRIPETSKAFENSLIILPQALNLPVTANGGYTMPSWFDIRSFNSADSNRYDLIQFNNSLTMIQELVSDIQKEYHIADGKVIVGGFSQGGALSLSANLVLGEKLAGVVVLSGFNVWDSPSNPVISSYINRMSDAAKKVPVFQGSGDQDPLVSVGRAEEAQSWYIKEAGSLEAATYDFKLYKGLAHSTSSSEMKDVCDFIEKALK
ncbi:hypothetical protein QEN19_000234 [Hanseniaspora menglaensis]